MNEANLAVSRLTTPFNTLPGLHTEKKCVHHDIVCKILSLLWDTSGVLEYTIQRFRSVFSQRVPPPPCLQYPYSFEVVTKINCGYNSAQATPTHYIARICLGDTLLANVKLRSFIKEIDFVAYFLNSFLLTTPPMTTCPACNPAPTTKPLQATGSTHRRRAAHSLSASTDCRLCRCSSSSAIAS